MTRTYQSISRGRGYELGLSGCKRSDPAYHEPEWTEAHEVSFPTGGALVREVRGHRHVGDATRVLFSDLKEEYRVIHPVPGGDHCTVLTVGDRSNGRRGARQQRRRRC